MSSYNYYGMNNEELRKKAEKDKRRNTAYGSRPDAYANTGLVKPPKVKRTPLQNTRYGETGEKNEIYKIEKDDVDSRYRDILYGEQHEGKGLGVSAKPPYQSDYKKFKDPGFYRTPKPIYYEGREVLEDKGFYRNGTGKKQYPGIYKSEKPYAKSGNNDNTFYTPEGKYGMMPIKRSKPYRFDTLEEYSDEFKKYDDKLEELFEKQYDAMIYGRDKELGMLDILQAKLEKAKEDLRIDRDVALGIRKPDTRNTHKDHFYRKGLMPLPYITDGQPPFAEGYFDRNGLMPIPYITDPNLTREDAIEFLSAKSTLPMVGLDKEKPPKVNTAYGSRPDDLADTGLVEPPKTNNFEIDYNEDMSAEKFFKHVKDLEKKKELIEKLGKPGESYLKYNNYPELTDTLEAAKDSNTEMANEIEQEIDKLKENYVNQELAKQDEVKPKWDNVNVKMTGDPDVIRLLQGWEVYGNFMYSLNDAGADDRGLAKMDIDVFKTEIFEYSEKEAYNLYLAMCNEKEHESDLGNDAFGGIIGTLPIIGDMYSLGEIIAKEIIGPTTTVNYELYDKLSGEYTVNTFIIDADLDAIGLNNKGETVSGGGTHDIIHGVILTGEPIILEDGTVIDNPINSCFVTSIEK